ncbi:hypothetical protein BDZ91DRAFT_642981, partial [Kalaharituber pfeilii]
AYAEWCWIAIELHNYSDQSLWITGLVKNYGKFYEDQSTREEIPASNHIGKEIKPKKSYTIKACGRSDSATGTDGSVTVSEDKDGNEPAGSIYWSVPW